MVWEPCSPPLCSVYNTLRPPSSCCPKWDYLSPLVENKQNCCYVSHMFLDDKGWNRFPVLIMRETRDYTFPMGKARLCIKFFCHIYRHDLTEQQGSLNSLVSSWQNIVYYNNYVLFIWDSCLKFKKKKKLCPRCRAFLPNQRSTKVSIETVIQWSPYASVPFIRDFICYHPLFWKSLCTIPSCILDLKRSLIQIQLKDKANSFEG